MKIKIFSFFITSLLFLHALSAADWFGYAADRSDFQIVSFDVTTETAGTNIPAGRSIGLAITPDASTLYAINQNIPNSVSVIDLATQTVTATVNLNAGGVDQVPWAIGITPDGTTAYIAAVTTASVPNLLKFDLASNTYTVIPINPAIQADSLAITPDGSMVYLTQTNAVVGMSTADNTFGTPVAVPGRTTRIAITPDGTTAYITDMINGLLYRYNLITQVVQPIILSSTSQQPTNLAISADGRWVYIANENVNYATAVDTLNSDAITDIPLGLAPTDYSQQGVAISPDSKKAVFTHSSVDAGGNNIISTVEVGTTNVTNTAVNGYPEFIAITPDQAPIASFTSVIAPAFSPSTFTSTSTTEVGTIASYVWDFGDGTIVTTTTNPIQHTYTSGGIYNVTLTVTNSGGTSTTQTFTGQTVSNNGGPSATITTPIAVVALAPIVTAVNPSSGVAGTVVNITGSNFTGVTNVQFGANPALFTFVSDNLIIATVPAGSLGTVPVTVTTVGGTSAVTVASQFTYLASTPVVTNVNPPSGNAGIPVTITGLNFTGATSVRFGSFEATFIVQSDTSILVTVPSGNQGTVPVTVTTVGGTSAITAASQFTYPTAGIILPPTSLKGKQIANKFATQTDYINLIKWQAPTTGIQPVAYRIYTDISLTKLVATVSANQQLKYKIHDRNKHKTYHYYIVSVGVNGETSMYASVTIKGHHNHSD